MITAGLVQQIMPALPALQLQEYLPTLAKAMLWAAIDRPLREAAFLAQIAHESCELTHWEEGSSGIAYEGNRKLGNSQPGDGIRFKGRGPIQITGRDNYTRCGQALGLDLVAHPELLLEAGPGFKSAAWYWRTHGCNALADMQAFDAITRRINGGLNGKRQRDAYYRKALAAMVHQEKTTP